MGNIKRILLAILAFFTLLPIFSGILGGILFVHRNRQHVATNVEALIDEADQRDRIGSWSVPGAMSIHSFMDRQNPFQLVRLNTRDWLHKLGLELPREYNTDEAPVNQLADLSHLVRNVRLHPELPREQWVFVTGFVWHELSEYQPWDSAFDALLQHTYTDSRLNNSMAFHFLDCSRSRFLCGVWDIQAPALLHFLVDDQPPTSEALEEHYSGLRYSSPLPFRLRPVTVRAIELPVEDVSLLALPSSTFPSPENQLKALITNPGLVESSIEPYDQAEFMTKRFREYMDSIWAWKNTPFPMMRQLESWQQDYITEPLGVEDYLVVLLNVVFTGTLLLSHLVLMPYDLIVELGKVFLAKPPMAEERLRKHMVPGTGDEEEDGQGGFFGMEQMLGGFFKAMEAAPGAPTGLESMWNEFTSASGQESPAPTV